ncbi:UDP-N-acetylglucosamine 4,6-dehydratase (inverting) [Candidatus Pelagibacter sp.]|nr:UDP-N-acetylglucosamine 4,6-dehydratase (inverting) [Candidatus Pelagibacter sp.]
MFTNKIILITGGTGSFGNEFVEKTLKKYNPKKIIIYSRDELKQFNMMNKFRSDKLRFFLGDIRDKERLLRACRGIDILIHAAALKQVVAAEYNPDEYIKTNINGAKNIIDVAIECKIKKVLALSTDKASNPINFYGVTKLASDKLMVAANNISTSKTLFSVVRYGNVSGSRGSVIPFFKRLIKEKSKFIPITDKNMTRFWITLDQAYDFVCNSVKNMKGGEMFIPKIPSIRILDLANAFDSKIKKKIVGIRPGEKLHETMFNKEECLNVIEFKNYYIVKPSIVFYKQRNYFINSSKEKGKMLKNFFEYNSGTNRHFLNINQINKLIN